MNRLFLIAAYLFLLSVATCDASWLVFHKPEFKGKIVDIKTNEPIEGAVIVVIYRKLQMAPGDAVDVDFDARETLSDKNGDFKIPSYTTMINPFSRSNSVDFYIFKPGYASLGPAFLEEVLSGVEKRDIEFSTNWNQNLKFRIQKTGVIMLPRVSGKDRIENYINMSIDPDFKSKLPHASVMEDDENRVILELKKQGKQ